MIKHSTGDFIYFPQGVTTYLEHTKQLISKEFLKNNRLEAEVDYKQFEKEELEKEKDKTIRGFDSSMENTLHQAIAVLRAIKRYLLIHDLTVIERREW